jgi:hypothetical protein
MKSTKRIFLHCALLLALLLGACSPGVYPNLPGIPDDLRAIPEALQGLELPELSGISLPDLGALGVLTAPPGAIVFAGPTAPQLAAGERLPGTDIVYEGMEGEDAHFTIAGLRSIRRMGDSVAYEGAWPGLPGSTYQALLRIYGFTDDGVWLAGVQQLLLPDIAPARGPAPTGVVTLRFPFVDGVQADGSATIDGTTFGYLGRYDRGAQIAGIPDGEYPYRSVGDSLVWQGSLRPDVGARYDLRTIAFGRNSLRVGGTVAVSLATE